VAPFLVILLLLALGAGIVAWHTIGYPHTPAPRRRSATADARQPERAAPPPPVTAEPVVVAAPLAFPTTLPRANDPFAHAPPRDTEPAHDPVRNNS
jgi:hypothetical protein